MTDGLIGASFAALAVGLGYVMFILQENRTKVAYLPSRQIKQALAEAARDTHEWRIKTRTASYFTREILPILSQNTGSTQIRVQLMDPRVETLLTKYAEFRSAHPDAAQWSAERVKREIHSSILLLALYSKRYPRISLDIRLNPTFWVQSLDCSGKRLFICGQNKGDTALVFDRGNEFFEHFMDDFDASFELAHPVTARISGVTLDVLSGELNSTAISSIQAMYSNMGFTPPPPDEVAAIVIAAKNNHIYV
ncbi:hypothetical protein [Nocardia neocaledoniensis]|uniref:hypothetical protein n=1 Tax=Nocardia neocaledoniensis TaxID=236511 RepID=UPI002454DDA0|nr:hypothetical protein [Nocardia neocaledoniensis]